MTHRRCATALIVAALLLAACGRGSAEQGVASRGPEPIDVTETSLPGESTTTTGWPPETTSTTATATTTSKPPAPPSTTKRSTTTTTPPESAAGHTTCAAPTVKEFPLTASGGKPIAVTIGGDGAVWFSDVGVNAVGRLGPDGAVSMFPLSRGRQPVGIATGHDGSIWFTQWVSPWQVGRPITPSPPPDAAVGHISLDGTMSEFPIPTTEGNPMGGSGVGPGEITAGPDGAMWFTETGADKIGRVTPDGTVTEYDLPGRSRYHGFPADITAGPAGTVWFSEILGSQLVRIDTKSGAMTEFPVTGTPEESPGSLVFRPDGTFWFTGMSDYVGRMTTGGVTKTFRVPATVYSRSWPTAMVIGPDGAPWFYESGQITRVDARGRFSKVAQVYPTGVDRGSAYPMASGPDAVWLAESRANQIARISCGT